jgi:two-component system, LytTR family, response regulator AlgR
MAAALQLLIVDDEPLARLRLRTLVQDLYDRNPQGLDARPVMGPQGAHQSPVAPSPCWQVVGEAGSADEALRWLQQQPVDALLLDVRMPGRNGLELAHALRRLPQPPAVVLVTAHAEHALRAFELNAVDYLTKPVRRERLAEALQRLAERVRRAPPPPPQGAAPAASSPAIAPAADASSTAPAVLVIAERDRIVRLPVAELWFCRAEQKQVLLRAASGSYVVEDSLAELEDRLTRLGGRFIRVHRNALVALGAMRQLELRAEFSAQRPEGSEGWAVRVAPLDEWLAVSRRQLGVVKAALAAPPGGLR